MSKLSHIHNYINQYEKEVHNSDNPFYMLLKSSLYEVENFNKEIITKKIISNINEENVLLSFKNALENNSNELRSEIYSTVNSNYNNVIVLMAKLKNVDFLIDNVEKPLRNAKSKAQSNLELSSNYELELIDTRKEIKKIAASALTQRPDHKPSKKK